jgi:hypothetical protein
MVADKRRCDPNMSTGGRRTRSVMTSLLRALDVAVASHRCNVSGCVSPSDDCTVPQRTKLAGQR